jgi:SAM-dependent methyltransferase
MFDNLRQDTRRLREVKPRPFPWYVLESLLFETGYQAVVLHRLAHWFKRHRIPFFGPLVARWNQFTTGVDIAPAAIRHARQLCRDLPCDFVLGDVRAMEPASGTFDAALYLFGQPTVQRPDDLAVVLRRIAAALRPGGRAALEILRADRVDRSATTSWWTSTGGLFGDGEHLVLYERGVDEEAEAVVERYHVIDAATGELRVHGLADRILEVEALGEALGRAGLDVLDAHPGWDGADVEGAELFVVVVAERR